MCIRDRLKGVADRETVEAYADALTRLFALAPDGQGDDDDDGDSGTGPGPGGRSKPNVTVKG